MNSIKTSSPHPIAVAIALCLTLVANPASAQEMDHSKMNMPMPKPAVKKPAAVKDAAAKPPTNKAAVKKTSAKKATDKPSQAKKKSATAPEPVMDHSTMQGMDHSSMPKAADEASMQGMDHSTNPMPVGEASMEGVDHSKMEGMDHSTMPMPAGEASMQGMDHSMMPGMDQAGMSMAPTEPREPIPVLTPADRAAAIPPSGGHAVHDNSIQTFVLLDRLEAWKADPGTGFAWEGQSWIGTDLNRVWLRSEGEQVDGKLDGADLEVFYGRSVARWWDVVAGIRHDFKPGASQDFAAIGVVGLAPYKFEVQATAYIGQGGQTAARFEAEYETLLTNRLILQPLVEVNLYGKDDALRGIGSGLSTVEAGLRLRYQFTRRFAPYIGVVRERAFGGTADFRRLDGESIHDTRVVVGLRFWF